MIECECKELLSDSDNIEYIRDQIGAILSVELANQFALAQEAADPAARDYNIGVYIENDDPLQLVDAGASPFPLVNLSLVSTEKDSGSTSINKHNMSATFLLEMTVISKRISHAKKLSKLLSFQNKSQSL